MNIPFLPDKTFKLFVYVGLGIMLFTWTQFSNKVEELNEKVIDFEAQKMQINFKKNKLNGELYKIKQTSDYLAKKSEVESPIKVDEKGFIFIRNFNGNQYEDKLRDTLQKLIDEFDKRKGLIAEEESNLEIIEFRLRDLADTTLLYKNDYYLGKIFGGFCLLFGLALWIVYEKNEVKRLNQRNHLIPRSTSNCQSCGRTFNSIVEYGTNKDSSTNYCFCNKCYSEGEFTEKNLTIGRYEKRITKSLKKEKKSEKEINKFIDKIRNLERWNGSDQYY